MPSIQGQQHCRSTGTSPRPRLLPTTLSPAAAQAPATYDRILSIEMFEHMKVGAGRDCQV
jgi:cyclopropane fatty-acyl-phospholipid synthase-like methyltransferase